MFYTCVFSECYRANQQRTFYFRISVLNCDLDKKNSISGSARYQDVNLILCQVFPGEVLPNMGEGEFYPACA